MTEKFSLDDQLDLVFHALADRTRRAMLARLAEGPAIVTELAAPFDMSLAAVSKHLRVLGRTRLVEQTVEGRIHRYSLAPKPLQKVDRWLTHYRSFWENTLDSLARYVEQNDND